MLTNFLHQKIFYVENFLYKRFLYKKNFYIKKKNYLDKKIFKGEILKKEFQKFQEEDLLQVLKCGYCQKNLLSIIS